MTGIDRGRDTQWVRSGLSDVTGRSDQPRLDPPDQLLSELQRLRSVLHGVDPYAVLAERATISGFTRHGTVSCAGSTRLLRAADGWIALTLARSDDLASIPAWLELDEDPADVWATVEPIVRDRAAAELVARGRLLGMPVAGVGEIESENAVTVTKVGRPLRRRAKLCVVDLSSLWAGPLCGRVLHRAGAQVVKVECRARPDGTRAGSPAFFKRLNDCKEQIALDFSSPGDVRTLRTMIESADVVIEASRPRALEQLGIVATDLLATGPSVWISITGYGRATPGRDWIAFGDDGAAAGGLVMWDGDGPCFCGDAIADPLSGLAAAAAAIEALEGEDAVLLDVAMARVAARCAGSRRS
jgi:hypothetical protein